MQKFLVYLPIIGIIVPFWIRIYLDIFLLKKLYKEVCVKGENKKGTIFFDKSQWECLIRVKDKYPGYTKRIEKYFKIYRLLGWISWISIGIIFILFIFGVIEYKPSNDSIIEKTEKLIVTRIENNKTIVKEYKNLKDFFK